MKLILLIVTCFWTLDAKSAFIFKVLKNDIPIVWEGTESVSKTKLQVLDYKYFDEANINLGDEYEIQLFYRENFGDSPRLVMKMTLHVNGEKYSQGYCIQHKEWLGDTIPDEVNDATVIDGYNTYLMEIQSEHFSIYFFREEGSEKLVINQIVLQVPPQLLVEEPKMVRCCGCKLGWWF